jgi:hypothetical protein
VGIWAFAALVFTLLAKASIAIEMGEVGAHRTDVAAGRTGPAVAGH